jgi:hypothetical protein
MAGKKFNGDTYAIHVQQKRRKINTLSKRLGLRFIRLLYHAERSFTLNDVISVNA